MSYNGRRPHQLPAHHGSTLIPCRTHVPGCRGGRPFVHPRSRRTRGTLVPSTAPCTGRACTRGAPLRPASTARAAGQVPSPSPLTALQPRQPCINASTVHLLPTMQMAVLLPTMQMAVLPPTKQMAVLLPTKQCLSCIARDGACTAARPCAASIYMHMYHRYTQYMHARPPRGPPKLAPPMPCHAARSHIPW